MAKTLEERPLFDLVGSDLLPEAETEEHAAGHQSSAPHHLGHRDRLRKRFREGGADALPDYELMELVLFRAIPRRDVKELAKAIIAKFGSFAEAVSAPPERLFEVKGVSDNIVTELKLAHAFAVRVAKGEVAARPLLTSWPSVLAYLRTTMAFEAREQVRILFLDKRNRLIADELQTKGTVDQTPVYIREVIKRALELSATALILAHNHPSGDPAPSRADIDMTKEVSRTAAKLGIIVHDHVIVGRDGYVSMKNKGFFEPEKPILLEPEPPELLSPVYLTADNPHA